MMLDAGVDIQWMFFALRKHWKLLLTSILIGILVALYYNHKKIPIYQAISKVRLPGSNNVNITTIQGITTPWNDVPTQIVILNSYNVKKRVIKKLKLLVKLYASSDLPVKIDSIEFNDDVVPESYIFKYLGNGLVNIKSQHNTEDKIADISKWISLQGGDLRIKFKTDKLIKGTVWKVRVKSLNRILKTLSAKIKVYQIHKSFIARIIVKDPDPNFAKKLADAYADAYVEYTLEDVRYAAKVLKDFLTDQLNVIEARIGTIEDTLYSLQKNMSYFKFLVMKGEPEIEKAMFYHYLDLVNVKYLSYGKYVQAQLLVDTLKKLLYISDTLTNEKDIQTFLLRIAELEREKSSLIIRFSKKHPLVSQIEERIKQYREELNSKVKEKIRTKSLGSNTLSLLNLFYQYQTDALFYKAKYIGDSLAVRSFEQTVAISPEEALRYFNLRRKLDALKQIYANLLFKLEEAKIEHASRIPSARVLDYALLPLKPISPNKKLNLYIGIFFGLIFGIALVITIEYIDSSVKTPESVEELLSAPVLALLPEIENNNRREIILPPFGENEVEGYIESLQRAKIKLEFLKETRGIRRLGIVSAGIGEGKTSFALNISILLAKSGYNVLLINGDMRKGTLDRIIFKNKKPEKGLHEFFHGASPYIVKTPIKTLDYFPSGTPVRFVSRYLARDTSIYERLAQISASYDFVIFDTPPLGIASETLLFANLFFEGVVVVVRFETTTVEDLRFLKKELDENEVSILGAIINRVSPKKGARYKYYYYPPQEEHILRRHNELLKKFLSFLKKL